MVENVEKVEASHIKDYIESGRDYKVIPGENVTHIFKNFSIFTDTIDNYRKGKDGDEDIKKIK
jgi:hypothetical protein